MTFHRFPNGLSYTRGTDLNRLKELADSALIAKEDEVITSRLSHFISTKAYQTTTCHVVSHFNPILGCIMEDNPVRGRE